MKSFSESQGSPRRPFGGSGLPMKRAIALIFLTGTLRALAAVSADPSLPSFVPQGQASSPLAVARTASTSTLVATWIAGFQRFHPEARVRQTETSTDLPAKALSELVSGEVDVAPFVREIQPQEIAAARKALGADLLGVAIATGSYATPSNTHAIAIYVNQSNPLPGLTLAQIDAIYSAQRLRGLPRIETWGQLGLKGEWANRPLHPYGMVIERKVGNPHAGIVAYLMERVMKGGPFDPRTLQVPDTGMGRGNNRALDEIAEAVAKDPLALGYSGFANARPGIRAVPLAEDAAGPYYAGTEEEVARRVYPLTRTIFGYARPLDKSPKAQTVREFLRYVLSREGQEAVAADPAHFLPLPEGFAQGERRRLEPVVTGPP